MKFILPLKIDGKERNRGAKKCARLISSLLACLSQISRAEEVIIRKYNQYSSISSAQLTLNKAILIQDIPFFSTLLYVFVLQPKGHHVYFSYRESEIKEGKNGTEIDFSHFR